MDQNRLRKLAGLPITESVVAEAKATDKKAKLVGIENWKSSKFFPKKVDQDVDPAKVAYNNMLHATIKSAAFPTFIKHSLLGMFDGGNTVFDSIRGFMDDFESAQHDWMYEKTLEEHSQSIIALGQFINEVYELAKDNDKTLVSWRKKLPDTYEEFVKNVGKIRLPKIGIKPWNVETIGEIKYVVDPDEIILVLDGKEVSKDKHNLSDGSPNIPTELTLAVWQELVQYTGLFELFTDTIKYTVKAGKVDVCSKDAFNSFK